VLAVASFGTFLTKPGLVLCHTALCCSTVAEYWFTCYLVNLTVWCLRCMSRFASCQSLKKHELVSKKLARK